MSAPTNPKKRALMASTKLRKTLRAAGHHLSPVVQVGKEGVSDAVLHQLDEQLAAHELVKVKIGTETPEDRFEAADRLGEASGAQVAQILGRTVLVYRKHPEHPRFEPKPAERTPRAPAPARFRAAPARRDAGRGAGGGRGQGTGGGRGRGSGAGRGGGRARGSAAGDGGAAKRRVGGGRAAPPKRPAKRPRAGR
jgi:RNA-binding protein